MRCRCEENADRIGEQNRDALRTQLRKTLAIEQLAVHRRLVDLEVAAMDDYSRRGANRQGNRIRSRMSDPDRLDFERSRLENSPRYKGSQVRSVKFTFDETPPYERERDVGSIDRHVELAQKMGQRADMVLVRMGKNYGLDRHVAALEP
jgi:hypothetical protein